jgi:hypothetical protein
LDNNPAGTRHGAQQMMELPLNRRQIGKDIGVIEFQVVQDQSARLVMDKLGALVEKRRVVFIRLDDKQWRCPQPCGN